MPWDKNIICRIAEKSKRGFSPLSFLLKAATHAKMSGFTASIFGLSKIIERAGFIPRSLFLR